MTDDHGESDLFASAIAPEQIDRNPLVHGRVLEVTDGSQRGLALMAFFELPHVRALHQSLRDRVEAALLSRLSAPVAHLGPAPQQLWFFAFQPHPGIERATHAFGFRPAAAEAPLALRALAHVRHEAHLIGLEDLGAPAHTALAAVAPPPNDALARAHERLLALTGDEAWGADPGAPCRRLQQVLTEAGLPSAMETFEDLAALEALLFSRDADVIRWPHPLFFQAYCDAVACVARNTFELELGWSVLDPDEGGLAPPPLVRVRRGQKFEYVELGLELLRFCVMPVARGEQVPPFAAWAEHAFGHGASA